MMAFFYGTFSSNSIERGIARGCAGGAGGVRLGRHWKQSCHAFSAEQSAEAHAEEGQRREAMI